jgi:ABC-2 type transport system permease protein
MKKTWIIALHEYIRHVFRWRFLFVLLSPVLMGLFAVVLALIAYSTQVNRTPVGYVDEAHLITMHAFTANIYLPILPLEFLPYPDEIAARGALERKDIQAYYVLPPDYRQTSKARLVYYQLPAVTVTTQFNNLLRMNLLVDQPPSVTHRVIAGSTTVIETTGDKQQGPINSLMQFILPIGIGYILLTTVMVCSGYLVQAIVEEKENRTMEILVTSASPDAIMTGKIFGLVSVGLTQLVVWSGIPLIGLFVFAAFFPALHGTVNWVSIALTLFTIVPTLFLICTLIAMISVTLGDSREGQAVTGFVMLPTMIPFALVETLSVKSSGALAVFLSLFPLTAANTLAIRMAFATVPAGQILLSAAILVFSTIGAFWLTGKIFRKWVLHSWKSPHWKVILRAVLHRPTRKVAV